MNPALVASAARSALMKDNPLATPFGDDNLRFDANTVAEMNFKDLSEGEPASMDKKAGVILPGKEPETIAMLNKPEPKPIPEPEGSAAAAIGVHKKIETSTAWDLLLFMGNPTRCKFLFWF